MTAFRNLIITWIVRLIARQEIDAVVNAGTLTQEMQDAIQAEIDAYTITNP